MLSLFLPLLFDSRNCCKLTLKWSVSPASLNPNSPTPTQGSAPYNPTLRQDNVHINGPCTKCSKRGQKCTKCDIHLLADLLADSVSSHQSSMPDFLPRRSLMALWHSHSKLTDLGLPVCAHHTPNLVATTKLLWFVLCCVVLCCWLRVLLGEKKAL